jgi:hypothetical protein
MSSKPTNATRAAAPGRPKQGPSPAGGWMPYSADGGLS